MTRRYFSFTPAKLGKVRDYTVRVQIDALVLRTASNTVISENDLADLVRAADAVVVAGTASSIDEALRSAERVGTPTFSADTNTSDPFPMLIQAVKAALGGLKAGGHGKPASIAVDELAVLRAYFASSVVRGVVSRAIGGEREDFDVVSENPLLRAQVMHFAPPTAETPHILVTSGFSSKELSTGCRFELLAEARKNIPGVVDVLAGLGKEMLHAGGRVCGGGVFRAAGRSFLLVPSELTQKLEWGVTVSTAVNLDSRFDGFFFRGTPLVVDFDPAPSKPTGEVAILRVAPLTDGEAALVAKSGEGALRGRLDGRTFD